MFETIKEFEGEYRFLSNFWMSPVQDIDGTVYPSVEHAYQAAKTNDKVMQEKIRLAKTPGEAKKLGQKVVIREDWDKIKTTVMSYYIGEKFKYGTELAEKLIETGDAELEEGNYWKDTFWGIDLKTGKGENNLGKILMAHRRMLTEPQV